MTIVQLSKFLSLLASTQIIRADQFATNSPPEPWAAKYGPQIDLPFSGPLSFSHIPYARCLDDPSQSFDIAILGMPFDTAVSYRPGARFGPYAIRSGSRRQRELRGYTLAWQINPYSQGLKIMDCGDVPLSPFDNALAMDQMEVAYTTLLHRPVALNENSTEGIPFILGKDGKKHPRIISLGGDHTIVLPILRSLHHVYGPISVIHFDAHLDTWSPLGYPGADTVQAHSNHGTFFWVAAQEGLLSNNSIHAGIRTKLTGMQDIQDDQSAGFELVTTEDIDDHGVQYVVRRIVERIGNSPVYLSFDIDVLDPSIAPGTGTPEAGGWTMREVKRVIRGLANLNVIGADLVEVAPSYDHAEITGIAAADLIHDFLSMMLTGKQESPSSVVQARGDNTAYRDEL